ncbi:MAG: helix-turn-helix domain-containing protein [Hyphomonadaceae bacterium]|nr:helix-turn-helix domain-containing protein [Hyphomonadaceae bacterium]
MGLPPDESVKSVGTSVQDLKNPKFRLPYDQLEHILEHAEKKLNLSNIGLETAFQFRLMSVGQTGSVLSYCNSLADAAVFNTQISSLIETIGVPSFERRPDGTFIAWNPHFYEHNKYRHVTEMIFGGYIITINMLTWSFEKNLKSVSFRHSAPSDTSRHREICLCPVKFDQEENSLEFYPEYVDRLLPSANPKKLEKIKTILNNMQRSSVHQAPVVVNAFAAIKKAIIENTLSTQTVATALNMSERTFRRRLLAEGLTYRNLVDEVRQAMCRDCMANNMSFTGIAKTLGFNDQSAFTRAFRKWYGTAPSNYRAIEFTI